MFNLNSLENIYLIVGFFVPGLIIMSVRSQFLTGRLRYNSETEALLSYLTISVIYYGLVLPFIDFILSTHESSFVKVVPWLILIFVGPALLGILLGMNIQKNWFRRALHKCCCLNTVHPMPTAWDWKFGDQSGVK